MKKIIVFVVLFVVAVIVYIAVGPFVTIHQIKSGVVQQDSEKLSEHIDFPALRSSIKEQLNAFVMKQAVTELKDNPFAALAMGFASQMVGGMVDSFVTPSGLASLMEGKKPKQSKKTNQPQNGEVQPQESVGQKPEPFKNARYTYDNSSKFSIWVRDDKGEEIRFVLTRDGLTWKLSNIIIPMKS